jgi:hypothetical protein
MIRSKTWGVALLGAAALLLAGLPAEANGIQPPSPISDSLTVLDGHGNVVGSVSSTEAQESADPGHLFYIDPADLPSSDLNTDAPLTYIGDPNGNISDVFGIFAIPSDNVWSWSGFDFSNWFGCSNWDWYCNSNTQYVLGFISDPLGADYQGVTCSSHGITCIPEGSGGPFDATNYLSSYKQGKDWTAAFLSDSESISSVPEPAANGLFCGLLALGLCVWKRRKIA